MTKPDALERDSLASTMRHISDEVDGNMRRSSGVNTLDSSLDLEELPQVCLPCAFHFQSVGYSVQSVLLELHVS